MTAKYTVIDSVTLTSSAASVTFSSIPQTYRDLVLVVDGSASSGTAGLRVSFNNDTGANYNAVRMYGNGSTATSDSFSNFSGGIVSSFSMTTSNAILAIQTMDYSSTDKHKSYLVRGNDSAQGTNAVAGRWANTASVTTLNFYSSNNTFAIGSTFRLLGVN